MKINAQIDVRSLELKATAARFERGALILSAVGGEVRITASRKVLREIAQCCAAGPGQAEVAAAPVRRRRSPEPAATESHPRRHRSAEAASFEAAAARRRRFTEATPVEPAPSRRRRGKPEPPRVYGHTHDSDHDWQVTRDEPIAILPSGRKRKAYRIRQCVCGAKQKLVWRDKGGYKTTISRPANPTKLARLQRKQAPPLASRRG